MFMVQTNIGREYHWLLVTPTDYQWTTDKSKCSQFQTRQEAFIRATDAVESLTLKGFGNLDVEVVKA